MIRLVVCVGLAVGLAACSSAPAVEMKSLSLDQYAHSASGGYRDSNASTAVQQPPALATLPADAGRVTRVSQKLSVEGIRQEIVYDQPLPGLGESGIDLRVRTSNASTLDEPLRMAKPTEAGIRSELASQFPKMAMQVVDRPRSNSYGPYGLAVGRWANGARCIYAWQWIDSIKSAASSDGGPASVRVRFCRKDVTLDHLASNMDRLQIDLNGYLQGDANIASARPLPDNSAKRAVQPAAVRTAQRRHRTRVVSLRERPQIARAPAISSIPHSAATYREAPLDMSLPAAAYRGPITTASTAGK